jgi:predicted nucleic-acid-binding Zn-ribbon protein
MMKPTVTCPKCHNENELEAVLTAQSNQNVIFRCPNCDYELKNIETSKG